jgi:hypothetical protein
MQLQEIVLCNIKRDKTKARISQMKKTMEMKMKKGRRKSIKKMKKDNSVDNSKIMMRMMRSIKMEC